jgi:hypothetical protein
MGPSTLKRLVPLPAISVVDRADNYAGLLLSELDSITSAVERFAGEEVSLEDAVFLDRHGIALDEEEVRNADPALIARLLVFANELEVDAETIREDAARLRTALLAIYRENVYELSGRRRMRGGDDA